MNSERISFYPAKDGLDILLGPLESKVMEIIWAEKKVSVKQVYYKLQKDSKSAYTTVMTIMNRLVDKELLEKKKAGRHFEYKPIMTRNQFIQNRIDLLNQFLKKLKSIK